LKSTCTQETSHFEKTFVIFGVGQQIGVDGYTAYVIKKTERKDRASNTRTTTVVADSNETQHKSQKKKDRVNEVKRKEKKQKYHGNEKM